MGALYVINTAVILLGTLVSVAYLLLYGLTAKWWRTFIGQQHLAISALLSVLYIRSSLLIILNQNPSSPRLFAFILATLVTAAVTWGLINYLRLQFWKRNGIRK